MTQYQTLAQMGITDVDNISRYSLRQEGNRDVLKIYFNNADDSLLPSSNKFAFERAVQADGAGSQPEMAPVIVAAIKELNQLNKPEHQEQRAAREQLAHELEHLERVMSSKLAELRSDLSKF
ncbi:DUF3461 family protein [Marinobacterium jannaschii]|uniref:DUF3461 family protein n=1 Tax=Marinobacterium jannaschii TaxID=64970 RepID=UPI0004819945|nr:DUF3461 family protein [Marinobacterium jannaschii]